MNSAKQVQKSARARRVRAKVRGTAERPRLNVFRSNRHIYGQLVDDETVRVLVSAHSLELYKSGSVNENDSKKEIAQKVGYLLGKKADKKNIKKAVFDRGPYKYHGRVKALAEGARQAGLQL